jgi:serine/threonine-protein kinase
VQLEVLSDPVPVVEQVMTLSSGVAEFSASRQGTLVYVPGGTGAFTLPSPPRSLVWVNRQGREEPVKAPSRAYAIPRLSPDGTRVAVDIRDQNNDIWIWDLARQTLERLTKDQRADMSPVWTPDGRRIIWASVGADTPNLFSQAADGTGTPKRLTTSMNAQFPSSISPDGKRLVFFEATSGGAVPDVAMMSLDGGSSTDPETLLHTRAAELNAEISPDGHWLAYQSNESGQDEIYVRPFPTVNDRRSLISTSGGTRPAWARSGRELFYLDGKGLLTAVPVETTTSDFKPGNPTTLLNTRYYAGASALYDLRGYDVSSDGQRFLMIKENAPADQTSVGPPASMVVMLNWTEELEARMPSTK